MSMKIYNIRLNTILTSGRFSELALVIVSLNHKRSSPNRTNGLPHLAVYRRNGLQWLETSTIRCQWIYSDSDLYLIKYNSDMRPCLSIVVLFPQIDCPRWLHHFPGPHLTESRRSEPQLSVTSWMYIVVWPWLQCQRKFVSADVSCNTFGFDWRNQYDLRTDRNQTSVNVE